MTRAIPTPDPLVSIDGLECQLLYFTSTSLSADDRRIVFLGDTDGIPNIYVFDCQDRSVKRLTDNETGYLRSYVYFDGRPYQGLGKASVCLEPKSGQIYYAEGRTLKTVDLDGRTRVLATLPGDEITAFADVSADGRFLCVPTVDARAFEFENLAKKEFQNLAANPSTQIDRRVQEEGLSSYINVYDTATGRLEAREPVHRAWITHVQFSPRDAKTIVYNHEWPVADCGVRRMWIWQNGAHRALRAEGEGRSRDDWTCHEVWERDGKAIVYHGTYKDGRPYVGRVFPDGSGRVEIPLPLGWTRYGHFTVGSGAGELVTDGHFVASDDDTDPICPWISRVVANWNDGKVAWHPLCRAGSSWSSQDAHPHPIFDHASRTVLFTSDRNGRREIFRVSAHG